MTQLANFMELFSNVASNLTHKGHALIKGILLMAMALVIYNHFDKLSANNFQVRVFPVKVPMYAVRFLQENNINGKILLPFAWGEYGGKGVQQTGHVSDQMLNRVVANTAWPVGHAITALVGSDRPIAGLGEGRELMSPGEGNLWKAMQQDNGRSFTELMDGHSYSIGFDVIRIWK